MMVQRYIVICYKQAYSQFFSQKFQPYLVNKIKINVNKIKKRTKTYKGISKLIGIVPLFSTTAQPTAGFLPYLAYAIAYES